MVGRAKKFNHTTSILNLDLDMQYPLDDTFQLTSDLMGMSGNEYRKAFTTTNKKLCSHLTGGTNLYYESLSKAMNIAEPFKCPFPKV